MERYDFDRGSATFGNVFPPTKVERWWKEKVKGVTKKLGQLVTGKGGGERGAVDKQKSG